MSPVHALLVLAAAFGGEPAGEVIDFSATYCGPCQTMKPIVARLEREGLPIRLVDIDEDRALANKFNITKIPTFVLVINGVEATRQVTQRVRGPRVLILTGYADDERVLDALRAGAYGYVIKRSDVNELLLAIQAVHRGNLYISASLSEGRSAIDLLMEAQAHRSGPADKLTEREREILQLVAEGYPNQSIADKLYLSVKTVEAHKSHIMAKLGVQKTADLIRYALRKGIISLDDEVDQRSGQRDPAGRSSEI